jgi:hypothetical protein
MFNIAPSMNISWVILTLAICDVAYCMLVSTPQHDTCKKGFLFQKWDFNRRRWWIASSCYVSWIPCGTLQHQLRSTTVHIEMDPTRNHNKLIIWAMYVPRITFSHRQEKGPITLKHDGNTPWVNVSKERGLEIRASGQRNFEFQFASSKHKFR